MHAGTTLGSNMELAINPCLNRGPCGAIRAAASMALLLHSTATHAAMRPPLNEVYWCNTPAFTADMSCGPAVPNRTRWNTDLCAALEELQRGGTGEPVTHLLVNKTVDVVVMPAEDETLWVANGTDGSYFEGLVGDAVNELAELGGFRWNAIVVNPPVKGDEYDGDWTAWALDWTNRADLIAVWFYDTPGRRTAGLYFPSSYYDLSPVLLVKATNDEESFDFWDLGFAWARPYSAQL